jgi:hypothetical protein
MVSAHEWGWVSFVAILLLVGIWLAGETVLAWLDRRIHGRPVLLLDTAARSGDVLSGRICFDVPAAAAARPGLEIFCESRRFEQGSGAATRKVWKFTTLWSQQIDPSSAAGGGLAFRVVLPSKLPGTLGSEDDNFKIVWRLRLRGQHLVPLERQYTLQVSGPAPSQVNGPPDAQTSKDGQDSPTGRWLAIGIAGLLVTAVLVVALAVLANNVWSVVNFFAGRPAPVQNLNP